MRFETERRRGAEKTLAGAGVGAARSHRVESEEDGSARDLGEWRGCMGEGRCVSVRCVVVEWWASWSVCKASGHSTARLVSRSASCGGGIDIISFHAVRVFLCANIFGGLSILQEARLVLGSGCSI